MANPATPADRFKIRQALERARNCEPDAVDRNTSAILETAITNLWQRIQDAPDSYVLNGDEFALFNYFRVRYRDNRTAQLAVERFWNNYRGNSANSDGVSFFVLRGRCLEQEDHMLRLHVKPDPP
ncbi:hypothetical protein EMGR_003817 [Emarellia grisea]|nr:hypothetical protein Y699_08379 [Aspergillus fumigatus Z5]